MTRIVPGKLMQKRIEARRIKLLTWAVLVLLGIILGMGIGVLIGASIGGAT